MKRTIIILGCLALTPLAACSNHGDDKLAERVKDAADTRADALESSADALDSRADQVRKTGKRRGDAIDAANVNANKMTSAQKDAIVANSAAAVP